MKGTLLILTCFVCGVLAGLFVPEQVDFDPAGITSVVLYLLLFLAGASVGGDNRVWVTLRQVRPRILLLPAGIIVGSLLGAAAISPLLPISLRDALAIGSGMGYYSLSSILIADLRGETLGALALLSNILRELLTFIIAPLLVRIGGKLGPIASGGATVMDTTLPVTIKYAGKEYVVIGFISAVVVTMAVPILIALIL
ncbi:MAG: lysine exporter LysO family protein [Chloroflexi bacterium]|nr:lysine exporter LysO family protein [Chloroflexota bacterium]MBP8060072.1 lysine exporter LysO family protein [Chloroflexota bacterium]